MKLVHLPWGGRDQAAVAGRAEYNQSFEEAANAIPDIEQYINKAGDDLHPIRVRKLFELVPLEVRPPSSASPPTSLNHSHPGLPFLRHEA